MLAAQAEAEAICKQEGGHLAYFNSAEEQDQVEKWLVSEVSRSAAAACIDSVGKCRPQRAILLLMLSCSLLTLHH